MILILPLGVLVHVHRNGYFLRRRPPQPPSPRRLWPGQAGQSLTSPSCLPSPSPEGPQSMVNFSGIFSVKFWRFPASVLGHPKKSVQKSVQHLYKQILQAIRAEIRAKKSGKKIAKNLCRKSVHKSVQKIRAENPCKKSVQKIRAENPCKKSVRNKPVQTASPK